MLILKQNAAASVPTPPAGKDTFFIDDSGTPSIKGSDGNVSTFPTTAASNAQVLFMNGTALTGDAELTYNYNTNVLTITGTATAGNIKTDNLLYANGSPWDLQQPGGSNTQVQFNDSDQFGGSANYTFNKTTNVLTVTGNVVANVVTANAGAGGSADTVGVYGNANTSGTYKGTGVQGIAAVTNTADTGAAVGVRGYATATHAGGYNIGVLGNAAGSGLGNYAFYVQAGNIGSIEGDTAWDLNDNSGTALAFNSSGKSGILAIGTTDGSEGVSMSGTLTVTGTATAGNVYANSGTIGAQNLKGEGGNISNIQGGNVSGAVASATAATTAGTVTTAAQPNITSVGTLTGLDMGGNIIPTTDSVYDLGNATNRFKDLWLSGNSLKIGGGTITANATSLVLTNPVGGQVVVSGTSIANGAALVNGNSNVVVAANGNVTTSVAGNSNILTVTGTGANISGTLNATGNANVGNIGAAAGVFTTVAGSLTTAAQPNVTSVGTLSSLNVSGAVTASTLVSNVATGTAPLTVTSTTRVANLDVAKAGIANTVNDAAQPNITSVGTLTSLGVTGDVTAGNVYANSGTIGASLLTGTLTTGAQPNITSVGTLSSATVTGNVVAGNVYANSGIIGAQNLKGEGGNISNIQGANVSGTVSSATTAGTVTTAAQPNITSVGTLTSLDVTGNVAAGNLTTTGVLSVTGTGVSSIAGNLDMTSNTIINLATPTNDTDAATKGYVDSVAQGLHVHPAVAAATVGTLDAATGGTVSYNNGTLGVGANLVTTGTFTTIDGVNIATVGTRVLVKNEANAAWNGIYTYTSSTVLTRATDADTSAEMNGGDFTFVQQGSTQADTGWVMTSDPPITIGTTNLVWSQFSGAGTYSAGTGLTLTGTTFSITNTAVSAASYGNGDRVASFTVNAQGQLTAASNVVIAANAANLTGTTLNSSIVTSSLTSVGTLGSLAVTANGTFGNVYANSGIIGAQTLKGEGGNISNIQGANVSGTVATATTAGTVTTAAQPNITSVGTLSSLAVTGNITGGNANVTGQLISTVATGTAPLVVTSTTQVANLSVATAGSATTAGTVTTAAQPNITSVGTLTSLGVSGTITAANITANTGVFTGNGNGLSSLQGANLTGTIATGVLGNSTLYVGTTSIALNRASGAQSLTGITSIDGYAATVSTAAQPNITSVGTLTSLGSSGNITAPNFIANTGFFMSSVTAAVSAAGTVQGNATALTTSMNVVSTVATGAGVKLPTAVAGMTVNIVNTSANALLVYPASGGKINALATDASYSLPTVGSIMLIATSATQWYTVGATYA